MRRFPRRYCNKSNALVGPILRRRGGAEKESEREPGQEKARSVVTLDDNLSGCSGSLRDLDTKIFLPSTQRWASGQVLSIVAGSSLEIISAASLSLSSLFYFVKLSSSFYQKMKISKKN